MRLPFTLANFFAAKGLADNGIADLPWADSFGPLHAQVTVGRRIGVPLPPRRRYAEAVKVYNTGRIYGRHLLRARPRDASGRRPASRIRASGCGATASLQADQHKDAGWPHHFGAGMGQPARPGNPADPRLRAKPHVVDPAGERR